jgi:hypothetical protein
MKKKTQLKITTKKYDSSKPRSIAPTMPGPRPNWF